MGNLYVAIRKAKEEMIRRFKRRKKIIEPYLRILDSRQDNQLYKNIHAAGYWFNPCNQFNIIEMTKHKQTISGLLDVIKKYCYGNPTSQSKLTSKMKFFRNAEGDFGRISTINEVMLPGKKKILIFTLVFFFFFFISCMFPYLI